MLLVEILVSPLLATAGVLRPQAVQREAGWARQRAPRASMRRAHTPRRIPAQRQHVVSKGGWRMARAGEAHGNRGGTEGASTSASASWDDAPGHLDSRAGDRGCTTRRKQ